MLQGIKRLRCYEAFRILFQYGQPTQIWFTNRLQRLAWIKSIKAAISMTTMLNNKPSFLNIVGVRTTTNTDATAIKNFSTVIPICQQMR